MATKTTASPQRLFEAACEELQRQGHLEGAVLVSRDGFPLAGAAPGAGNIEVFAAMHATALGAAEVALAGLGPTTGITLVAQHAGRKFVSRGVSRTLFVVACIRDDADCHALFAWMDAFSARLDA